MTILNEEALAQIEEAVRKGVEAGLAARPMFGAVHIHAEGIDVEKEVSRTRRLATRAGWFR
jgi:hypothetical protein